MTRLRGLIGPALGEVFPALSLAVIHRDAFVLEAAWGWIDPETRENPAQTGTLFDLASLTKLFTTTAFLSLVADGRATLDTTLVSVVPEFGAESPRDIDGGQDPHTKTPLPVEGEFAGQRVDPARVTFRHLLTHTSGLAPWRAVYLAAGLPPPPPTQPDPQPRAERWARALEALCRYPFVGQPAGEKGGIVRYSDLGLMLLGEAVSRLHGTPGDLEPVIQARVIAAVELPHTLFNPVRNGFALDGIAPTEYDPAWRKRRVWGEVHDENAAGVGGVAGHAGLFAPARSVALFGRAWLYEPGVFGLSAELAAVATVEHALTGEQRRGLGWLLKSPLDSPAGQVFSAESYGHTGFTGTSLWIDPARELVVACLTNRVYPGREKPGIHAFRQALHDLLADELN
jgi:serine-type D-Ala-D-Ala carboxypeptidase